MEVLYLASSVLSLFFILILVVKKNKNASEKILLIWFFLLFTNVVSFYLIIKNAAPVWLIEFLNNSVFLHGPLLLFYTSALTGMQNPFRAKNLFHFIPFVLFLIATIWIQMTHWKYTDRFYNFMILVKFLFPLGYVVYSLRLIYRFRNRLTDYFSTTNQLELKWLSNVLYGSIVLAFFGAVTYFIHFFTPVEIPQFGGKYLNIAYSVSIIVLAWFGFRQTSIFIPTQFQNAGQNEAVGLIQSAPHDIKPADSKTEKIYSQLLGFMDKEVPFLDKNLSLFKLAEQLEVSENKLSHVINSQSGLNFFEFVNKYRVEYVIAKMKKGEYKTSTLLGLAFDSGFNSKASFNRAFKKFTNLTPSQFLADKID